MFTNNNILKCNVKAKGQNLSWLPKSILAPATHPHPTADILLSADTVLIKIKDYILDSTKIKTKTRNNQDQDQDRDQDKAKIQKVKKESHPKNSQSTIQNI